MSRLPYDHSSLSTATSRQPSAVQPTAGPHGVLDLGSYAVKHAPYVDKNDPARWDQRPQELPAKRPRLDDRSTGLKFVSQRKWKFDDSQPWIEVQTPSARRIGAARKAGPGGDTLSPQESPGMKDLPSAHGTQQDSAFRFGSTGDASLSASSDVQNSGMHHTAASQGVDFAGSNSHSLAKHAGPTYQSAVPPRGHPPMRQHQSDSRVPSLQRPPSRTTPYQSYSDTQQEKPLPPQVAPKGKTAPNEALSLEKDGDRIAALMAEKREENEANLFRQRLLQKQREHQKSKSNKQLNGNALHATSQSLFQPQHQSSHTQAHSPSGSTTQSQVISVSTGGGINGQTTSPNTLHDLSNATMDFPSPLMPQRKITQPVVKETGWSNLSLSAKPIIPRPISPHGRSDASENSDSASPQMLRETSAGSTKYRSYNTHHNHTPSIDHGNSHTMSRTERRSAASTKNVAATASTNKTVSTPASRRSSSSGITKSSPSMMGRLNINGQINMTTPQEQLYMARNPSMQPTSQQIGGAIPDLWMPDTQMHYVAKALDEANDRAVASAPSTQMSSPALSTKAMPSPPKMQVSHSQQGVPPRPRHIGSMSIPPQPPNTPYLSGAGAMAPSMHPSMSANNSYFEYGVSPTGNQHYYYASTASHSNLMGSATGGLSALSQNANPAMAASPPHLTGVSAHVNVGAGDGRTPSSAVHGYTIGSIIRKEGAGAFSKEYNMASGNAGRSLSMAGN